MKNPSPQIRILEQNSLDWNVNELEHELELEDMKHTILLWYLVTFTFRWDLYLYIKFVIFQDQTTALEDKRRQLNQAFEKEVIHIMALDMAVAECTWGPINMVIS